MNPKIEHKENQQEEPETQQEKLASNVAFAQDMAKQIEQQYNLDEKSEQELEDMVLASRFSLENLDKDIQSA